MKLYSITIRGKRKEWCINVYARPEWVKDWREDGLIVDEIVNIVPQCIIEAGLLRPFVFLQDIWKAVIGL